MGKKKKISRLNMNPGQVTNNVDAISLVLTLFCLDARVFEKRFRPNISQNNIEVSLVFVIVQKGS